jgi:hypothetical protein
MEVAFIVMLPQMKEGLGFQKLEEARKDPPKEPANTLTSHFWPPEL